MKNTLTQNENFDPVVNNSRRTLQFLERMRHDLGSKVAGGNRYVLPRGNGELVNVGQRREIGVRTAESRYETRPVAPGVVNFDFTGRSQSNTIT